MPIIYFLGGLLALGFFLNWLDYTILKKKYLKAEKFDFNICCGGTACDGVNADIVRREVPRFILTEDIYHLPFKNKQFKSTICSHTMEHVDDPKKFFKELQRVSENVTLLLPPLWDFGCMINIWEHRRQFLILRSKHKNQLPRFFNLPFSKLFQKTFGQQV